MKRNRDSDQSASDPPIVSHRNHASCLDEYVEMAVRSIGSAGVIPPGLTRRLRPVVREVMSLFLHSLSYDFAKAAERGIDQMVRLIEDPVYFEKKKASRKRQMEQMVEDKKQREQARLEKQMRQPTPEEVEQERNSLEMNARYHRRELAYINERLALLGQPATSEQPGAHIQ